MRKLGSPPPMRGKVPRTWLCTTVSGITPAYAGKRFLPASGLLPE